MFTAPTLFILGAGASWHYGYPTGADLIKKVGEKASSLAYFCKECRDEWHDLPLYITEKMQTNNWDYSQAWDAAAKECRTLAERLKHVNPLVIDYFLGHNRSLEKIGKLLIAWAILDCEAEFANHNYNRNRKGPLYNTSATSVPPFDPEEYFRDNDDWYRFLVEELVTGCEQASDLTKNKLHIITFNYDVSLEQNLSGRLRAIDRFGEKEYDQIKSFLDKRIYHVYGAVRNGFVPPRLVALNDSPIVFISDEPGIDLKEIDRTNNNWNIAYEASKNLNVIDPIDKNNGNRIPNEWRKRVMDAWDIYILGYGFDNNNSHRLYLNEIFGSAEAAVRSVRFTNFQDSNRVNKRTADLYKIRFDSFLPSSPGIVGHPYSGAYYEKSVRDVYGALNLDFEVFSNKN
jgi:sulfur relay (sulfurtransferase) DsrC/TusE family protein